MPGDSRRLSKSLPSWIFPQSLVGLFPDGRPLAGAGLALGITLYLLGHLLDTLSIAGQADLKAFLVTLTGHRLLLASPFLVIAVMLTGSRTQPATDRQINTDEWTLAAVVVLAAIVSALAALGFVVQFTDLRGGLLPTVNEFLIHAGAVVSAGTTAIWALGRLHAAREGGSSAQSEQTSQPN